MAFYAGQLTEKIVIQKVKTRTVDQYGRPGKTWEDYKTLWAKVTDVSNREYFDAAARQLEKTVTFTVRAVNGITADMRVSFKGTLYGINEVNHLGYKGDFLQLKTMAIGAEANG